MNRPCSCGQMPSIIRATDKPAISAQQINIIRISCTCGEHGATLMYTKLEDRARMEQAAWDGWNLAG